MPEDSPLSLPQIIPMQPSPLNLHFYYVTDLTFAVNPTFKSSGNVLPEDADLRILTDVKRSDDPGSEAEWIVTLKVQQLAADNLPVSFLVETVGHFSAHPDLDEEKRLKLLRQNGAAILFGSVREIVRSITGMGPLHAAHPALLFIPAGQKR